MVQSPIVNAGLKYVNGLNLSFTSARVIAMAAGAARNSSNENDIVLSAAVAINAAVDGANGLDSGALAANAMYAVYVIGDSTGYNDAAGLMSLASNSAPSLPSGYDMYRRVGYVLANAVAAPNTDLLAFDQKGNGEVRDVWYRASIATDITAGSSATFAAVDISASVPSGGKVVLCKCTFTPTGANDELALRSGDSSTDEGQAVASGSAAGVVKIDMLSCPVGATLASGIDYKVTGSAVAINVQGYSDVLE